MSAGRQAGEGAPERVQRAAPSPDPACSAPELTVIPGARGAPSAESSRGRGAPEHEKSAAKVTAARPLPGLASEESPGKNAARSS